MQKQFEVSQRCMVKNYTPHKSRTLVIIEHLVGPSRSDSLALEKRVRKRIEQTLREGGHVLVIDLARTLVFESWFLIENGKNFLTFWPENVEDVPKAVEAACCAEVSLVVVHQPKSYAPDLPWIEIRDVLRAANPESTLLLVNSFRVKEEAGMEAYAGFEPFTSMADREEIVE